MPIYKHKALSKYCLLRNSERLRMFIKQRLKSKGMSVYRLAKLADTPRKGLTLYLEGKEAKDRRAVSQWMLLKICRHLDITIDLKIELNDV